LSGNGWLCFARSGHGNGRVAMVTPRGSHRPSRCYDAGCPRAPCRRYREGREDGYEGGFKDGYRAGYAAGYTAGQAAGQKG